MAGQHAIFRLTNGVSTTEASVSDKIEFGTGALVPDSKGQITSIMPVYQAIGTDNPNPGSQDSPNSQDSGNAPFTIEIRGHFDESAGATSSITNITNWTENPKVIKTLYPKGRFGWRSDERPEYDVVPVATGGYKLDFVQIIDPVESPRIEFIIRLKFVGVMSIRGA